MATNCLPLKTQTSYTSRPTPPPAPNYWPKTSTSTSWQSTPSLLNWSPTETTSKSFYEVPTYPRASIYLTTANLRYSRSKYMSNLHLSRYVFSKRVRYNLVKELECIIVCSIQILMAKIKFTKWVANRRCWRYRLGKLMNAKVLCTSLKSSLCTWQYVWIWNVSLKCIIGLIEPKLPKRAQMLT